jgi:hypothetical protein
MPFFTKCLQRPRRSKQHFLFDHFVGGGEQRRQHRKPKRRGGLEADDKLEFDRLQKANRLVGAVENSSVSSPAGRNESAKSLP